MKKLLSKIAAVGFLTLLITACADDLRVLEKLQAMKPNSSQTLKPLPIPAADDQDGQFELGQRYLERNDWSSAMEWFSVCANAGHKPCVKELGYGYLQGVGVEADPYLGLQLLETSLDETDPAMLNDLAWFMATSKVASLRNPEKALELISLLLSKYELDAMSADTLAAAQASAGLFEQAAQTQRKALNMLLRQGPLARNSLSNYRHRLSLYQNEQAYLE